MYMYMYMYMHTAHVRVQYHSTLVNNELTEYLACLCTSRWVMSVSDIWQHILQIHKQGDNGEDASEVLFAIQLYRGSYSGKHR